MLKVVCGRLVWAALTP
ncbi:hypothetical protein M2G99_20570 [Vibrio vulnificus]|nr:hypothetical protein [Vibrio vulnificus]MCU8203417.1 hypothetical protein [Vibrio vulnificus]MCU8225485.1 hypothetical protein [Vibrio vulnificus]MCU8361281.1 hypothetical protein [Vibrio vulnificus]MCU8361329.1 hypothetical protein [Vibrio vulnificus]MCU8461678.1 hypothetical protein [Vibrio vulnificus]